MNRWKFAKASAFTTDEGSGQVRTAGEDGNGPIKKPLSDGQRLEDDATAAAVGLSRHLSPQGEDGGGPIKKPLSALGSQRLQAARPDDGLARDGEDARGDQRACAETRPPRRRRRRRRSTRTAARSTP